MVARFAKFVLTLTCCAVMITASQTLSAQDNGGNNGGGGNNDGGGGNTTIVSGGNFGVVGGVSVDPSGVVGGDKQVINNDLRQKLEAGLRDADPDINAATRLRMISLRGLEAAINKSRDQGRPLPADVRYMAGLQRIEFVVLSPETNDVIIAGPGEGWKLDANGNVVGNTSGTPVIQLEDFLVAMRSVDNARSGQGISVSIDPTQEGIKQLQRLFKSFETQGVSFRPNLTPEVEKAMGQHVITLTGVPEDSRFSQILVAADYKMKRLSMGLEEAPISGLPSFMEMAAAKRVKSMRAAPRFWMECNYEPVGVSEDGTVWQIRGTGVKTLTQESHFDKDGKREITAKQNRFAVKWAELMTEKFEALAAAEPAFRELRNVMDLSVIAAIIKQENLADKVNLQIPAILGLTDVAATPSWTVPKAVPTECSFVKLSGSWLVSASGGIQLDSWGVASNTQADEKLAAVSRQAMAKSVDRWWWNAAN